MSISVKDVEYVADLARLTIEEDEKIVFTDQLNSILNYAEKLNELQTDHVEPTTHVLNISNVTRKDEVIASIDRDKALANAADKEDGYFKVPPIIE